MPQGITGTPAIAAIRAGAVSAVAATPKSGTNTVSLPPKSWSGAYHIAWPRLSPRMSPMGA